MIQEKLKIGDIVKRFELSREVEYEYVIVSITKTQAKSKDGQRFKIDLRHNSTKITDDCIAEAIPIPIGYSERSSRYFLIKKATEL